MFTIYSTHKKWFATVTRTAASVSEGKEFAEACAELGTDRLIRVFSHEGVTGETFVTAWSVLDGEITEHSSPTIPAAHF